MTQKSMRDLHRTIASLGLVIISQEVTGGSHLKMRLEAPNGVQDVFYVARTGSDHRGEKNNESRMRRFARENPAPATTALQDAFARAAVTPPAPPTPAINQVEPAKPEPEPEPEKPKMTTDTTAATQQHRLDRAQFHKLTKWVSTSVPQGREITLTNLAREASDQLSFVVAESTMRDALDLEEIKLGEVKKERKGTTDRIMFLAREIIAIRRELGDLVTPPSDTLLRLAGRLPAGDAE